MRDQAEDRRVRGGAGRGGKGPVGLVLDGLFAGEGGGCGGRKSEEEGGTSSEPETRSSQKSMWRKR